jgi:hypothetical protein
LKPLIEVEVAKNGHKIIYTYWQLVERVGGCQHNHRSKVPKLAVVSSNMLSGQSEEGMDIDSYAQVQQTKAL